MENRLTERKTTVLVFLESYLPGFKAGGPLRSIENLVGALGEEFQFRIITLDRDLGDKVPYPVVAVNRWVRVGKADVMYLRPGWRGLLRVVALLRSVDSETVLYLNSYFARLFSMLAMLTRWLKLCRPRSVVLAPRGEFSPGALSLKRRRKLLFITISRWFGIHKNIIWHASTELEVTDILRMFPQLSNAGAASSNSNANYGPNTTGVIVTARDLAALSLPVERRTRQKTAGRLRVVFISRISRKKNLLGALRTLERVSGDVTVDIYGPLEDMAYWDECQRKIAALPTDIRVKYWGKIDHEKVGHTFAEHDLFLFPTLGENYGHVIHEALAEGCPVLISDQTPWRNLEDQGVGWDIPLDDKERFQSVLQQCVDADDTWYSALSIRARNYAEKCGSTPETVEANRSLFRFAAAR